MNIEGMESRGQGICDGVEITAIGVLHKGPLEKKYWSSSRGKEKYPYPVGYQATRWHGGHRYFMEVSEGPRGPVFGVTCEEGITCSGQTPSIPWEDILKKRHAGAKKVLIRSSIVSIDGPEMFGFTNPLVQRLCRDLLVSASGVAEHSGVRVGNKVKAGDANESRAESGKNVVLAESSRNYTLKRRRVTKFTTSNNDNNKEPSSDIVDGNVQAGKFGKINGQYGKRRHSIQDSGPPKLKRLSKGNEISLKDFEDSISKPKMQNDLDLPTKVDTHLPFGISVADEGLKPNSRTKRPRSSRSRGGILHDEDLDLDRIPQTSAKECGSENIMTVNPGVMRKKRLKGQGNLAAQDASCPHPISFKQTPGTDVETAEDTVSPGTEKQDVVNPVGPEGGKSSQELLNESSHSQAADTTDSAIVDEALPNDASNKQRLKFAGSDTGPNAINCRMYGTNVDLTQSEGVLSIDLMCPSVDDIRNSGSKSSGAHLQCTAKECMSSTHQDGVFLLLEACKLAGDNYVGLPMTCSRDKGEEDVERKRISSVEGTFLEVCPANVPGHGVSNLVLSWKADCKVSPPNTGNLSHSSCQPTETCKVVATGDTLQGKLDISNTESSVMQQGRGRLEVPIPVLPEIIQVLNSSHNRSMPVTNQQTLPAALVMCENVLSDNTGDGDDILKQQIGSFQTPFEGEGSETVNYLDSSLPSASTVTAGDDGPSAQQTIFGEEFSNPGLGSSSSQQSSTNLKAGNNGIEESVGTTFHTAPQDGVDDRLCSGTTGDSVMQLVVTPAMLEGPSEVCTVQLSTTMEDMTSSAIIPAKEVDSSDGNSGAVMAVSLSPLKHQQERGVEDEVTANELSVRFKYVATKRDNEWGGSSHANFAHGNTSANETGNKLPVSGVEVTSSDQKGTAENFLEEKSCPVQIHSLPVLHAPGAEVTSNVDDCMKIKTGDVPDVMYVAEVTSQEHEFMKVAAGNVLEETGVTGAPSFPVIDMKSKVDDSTKVTAVNIPDENAVAEFPSLPVLKVTSNILGDSEVTTANVPMDSVAEASLFSVIGGTTKVDDCTKITTANLPDKMCLAEVPSFPVLEVTNKVDDRTDFTAENVPGELLVTYGASFPVIGVTINVDDCTKITGEDLPEEMCISESTSISVIESSKVDDSTTVTAESVAHEICVAEVPSFPVIGVACNMSKCMEFTAESVPRQMGVGEVPSCRVIEGTGNVDDSMKFTTECVPQEMDVAEVPRFPVIEVISKVDDCTKVTAEKVSEEMCVVEVPSFPVLEVTSKVVNCSKITAENIPEEMFRVEVSFPVLEVTSKVDDCTKVTLENAPGKLSVTECTSCTIIELTSKVDGCTKITVGNVPEKCVAKVPSSPVIEVTSKVDDNTVVTAESVPDERSVAEVPSLPVVEVTNNVDNSTTVVVESVPQEMRVVEVSSCPVIDITSSVDEYTSFTGENVSVEVCTVEVPSVPIMKLTNKVVGCTNATAESVPEEMCVVEVPSFPVIEVASKVHDCTEVTAGSAPDKLHLMEVTSSAVIEVTRKVDDCTNVTAGSVPDLMCVAEGPSLPVIEVASMVDYHTRLTAENGSDEIPSSPGLEVRNKVDEYPNVTARNVHGEMCVAEGPSFQIIEVTSKVDNFTEVPGKVPTDMCMTDVASFPVIEVKGNELETKIGSGSIVGSSVITGGSPSYQMCFLTDTIQDVTSKVGEPPIDVAEAFCRSSKSPALTSGVLILELDSSSKVAPGNPARDLNEKVASTEGAIVVETECDGEVSFGNREEDSMVRESPFCNQIDRLTDAILDKRPITDTFLHANSVSYPSKEDVSDGDQDVSVFSTSAFVRDIMSVDHPSLTSPLSHKVDPVSDLPIVEEAVEKGVHGHLVEQLQCLMSAEGPVMGVNVSTAGEGQMSNDNIKQPDVQKRLGFENQAEIDHLPTMGLEEYADIMKAGLEHLSSFETGLDLEEQVGIHYVPVTNPEVMVVSTSNLTPQQEQDQKGNPDSEDSELSKSMVTQHLPQTVLLEINACLSGEGNNVELWDLPSEGETALDGLTCSQNRLSECSDNLSKASEVTCHEAP